MSLTPPRSLSPPRSRSPPRFQSPGFENAVDRIPLVMIHRRPPNSFSSGNWCNGSCLCLVLYCIVVVGLIIVSIKPFLSRAHLLIGHGIPVECGNTPQDQDTEFIVAFNPGYTADQVAAVCQNLPAGDRPSIEDQRCVIRTSCQKIQHFILHRSPQGYQGMLYVEADSELKLRTPVTEPANPSNYRWNLERVTRRRPDFAYRYHFPAAKGKGVHIYVLDSGIRTTHEDFAGRAIPTLETIGGRVTRCSHTDVTCAADSLGHGTHCAAIAAGRKSGIASEAVVHAVKVMDDRGHFLLSWVAKAIDWVRNHGERPAIISMSLESDGGIGRTSYTLDLAVHDAVREGVQVFVAAGNARDSHTEGKDACKLSPGKEPYAVTVASTDQNDRRDIWSNFGRCVDMFAPGNEIISAWYTSNTAYQRQSGTSQAAPLAAGVAAVALSQGVLQPALASWMVQASTKDVVKDPKGSPNLMLYLPP